MEFTKFKKGARKKKYKKKRAFTKERIQKTNTFVLCFSENTKFKKKFRAKKTD